MFADTNNLKEHNGIELNRLFENISITNNKFLCVYFTMYPYLQRIGWLFAKYRFGLINKAILFKVITFPVWENYQLNDSELVQIRYIFSFPSIADKANLQIRNKIKETNSVSIHIRRGDYIKSPIYRRTHGNVCTSDYYIKSIEYILQHVKKPVFLFLVMIFNGQKITYLLMMFTIFLEIMA